MEIIGRIVRDAQTRQTRNGKQVVNFSLALNETYRDSTGQRKERVLCFECAYWLSANAAQVLRKGSVVLVSGNMNVSAFISKTGDAKAQLHFHVNNFKTFSSSAKPQEQTAEEAPF